MRILTRLPLLSLAALSLAFGAGAACSHPSVQTVETAEAIPVAVQPARLGTVRSTIVAPGTIAPAPGGDWTITAPQQGTIVELPKNEGDAVKTGDLLVRFDIPGLAADLSARNAEVAQADTRVSTAKARATTLAGLADRGIAARKDVLDAQLAQTEAEQALKEATGAQQAAAALADRAAVKARFNGVIAKRWHNPGDRVESSAGDPVLRVVDPSRTEIVAAVPAGDLPRVFVSRPANISDPATGAIEAAVVMTRPAAADSNSATVDVRLRFAAPTTMAVGAAVGVEIIADERTNVLVVPAAAIVRDGGEIFVMVAGADNKAHKRLVSLGLVARDVAQITDGLKAGDQVIIRGLDALSDGAPISIGG